MPNLFKNKLNQDVKTYDGKGCTVIKKGSTVQILAKSSDKEMLLIKEQKSGLFETVPKGVIENVQDVIDFVPTEPCQKLIGCKVEHKDGIVLPTQDGYTLFPAGCVYKVEYTFTEDKKDKLFIRFVDRKGCETAVTGVVELKDVTFIN